MEEFNTKVIDFGSLNFSIKLGKQIKEHYTGVPLYLIRIQRRLLCLDNDLNFFFSFLFKFMCFL
jgi:hypothetical protein